MPPGTSTAPDIWGWLAAGRYDLFIIGGLVLYSVWATVQWRAAEKGRLEDLKTIVALAVEVKNHVATLVDLIKDGRRSR